MQFYKPTHHENWKFQNTICSKNVPSVPMVTYCVLGLWYVMTILATDSYTLITTVMWSSILNWNPTNISKSFLFSTSKRDTLTKANFSKSCNKKCISPTCLTSKYDTRNGHWTCSPAMFCFSTFTTQITSLIPKWDVVH